MTVAACLINRTSNQPVPLSEVALALNVRELCVEVHMTQRYRNREAVNIEAVYTFPVPPAAVLLGFTVVMGERRLNGVVRERKVASQRYESALDAGDSAVLLEQVEPGLYTLNLGNLLAGEEASIEIRYAQVLRWAGEHLRISLPTTIAPRFGQWRHQPHQEPSSSLQVENHFSLTGSIEGQLAEADIDCPSHRLRFSFRDQRLLLTLRTDQAVMDRDLVLNLRTPRACKSFTHVDSDVQGMTALASFQPEFGPPKGRPLRLAIVVDSSGSMAGVSIRQARQALLAALDSLTPDDAISCIAFGTEVRPMRPDMVKVSPARLAEARQFVDQLDGRLGGTEMGKALAAAIEQLGESGARDIFLITDGQVNNEQDIIRRIQGQAGLRVFSVGVGSAVSEGLLRSLAAATAGAVELVAPGEGMAERVLRHFQRLRAERAVKVAVQWPEGAEDAFLETADAVFSSDTLLASARFPGGLPEGASVNLSIETERGEHYCQELPLTPPAPGIDGLSVAAGPSTTARLAAAQRLTLLAAEGAEESATALALRYQLMSPYTSYLVVLERAEGTEAISLPALRHVPQTMAAGWGGTGSKRSAGRPTGKFAMNEDFSGGDDGVDCDDLTVGSMTVGSMTVYAGYSQAAEASRRQGDQSDSRRPESVPRSVSDQRHRTEAFDPNAFDSFTADDELPSESVKVCDGEHDALSGAAAPHQAPTPSAILASVQMAGEGADSARQARLQVLNEQVEHLAAVLPALPPTAAWQALLGSEVLNATLESAYRLAYPGDVETQGGSVLLALILRCLPAAEQGQARRDIIAKLEQDHPQMLAFFCGCLAIVKSSAAVGGSDTHFETLYAVLAASLLNLGVVPEKVDALIANMCKPSTD